jgi:hypothetical protein
MSSKLIFKVMFYNQGDIYEIYARQIYQSEIYGFIEVEELVFGENTQMIVDPGEEKLKNEFSGVKRTYIPMHSIVRIDEVEKEGNGKIREVKIVDKIANFPQLERFKPKPKD